MSLLAVSAVLAMALVDGRPANAAPPPGPTCVTDSGDLRIVRPVPPPFDVDPGAKVVIDGIVNSIQVQCGRIYLRLIDDDTGQPWKVELERSQLAGLGLKPDSSVWGRELVVGGLRTRDATCASDCLARATNLRLSISSPEPARWPLDGSEPMVLTGTVTAVEQRDGLTIAHLAVGDTDRWAVDLGSPGVIRQSRTAPPRVGALLSIRGFRAADKVCAPECKAGARRFRPAPYAELASPRTPPAPPAIPSIAVDESAPVLIKGTVTGVDWAKPHVRIHVTQQEGQRWVVEGGSPTTMLRAGITRDSLKAGTAIIVRGYQAKDKRCTPECQAVTGRDITFPDGGRKVIFGSMGISSLPAPPENRQPSP